MPPPAVMPGAQRFEEHHRLALVVHRAARDEALAVRAVDKLRLERRAVPQLQRIDRLHVVMAIEQHVRAFVVGRAVAMRRPPPDGPAVGRTSARKPSPASCSRHHSAARRQSCCVRRLRADRGDAQQLEQVVPGLVERGVGVAEDGFNGVGRRCGHSGSPGGESIDCHGDVAGQIGGWFRLWGGAWSTTNPSARPWFCPTPPPAAPASAGLPDASGWKRRRWRRSPALHRPAARRAPAPSTASARPANFPRSSASVRKFAGSPFGTTTFCANRRPRASMVSLPDMLAGNSASISGSNSQVTFGSRRAHRGSCSRS